MLKSAHNSSNRSERWDAACQRLNPGLSQQCAHPFEEGSLWWLFRQLLGYLFLNNISLVSFALWRHKHYLGRFYLCNSLLSYNFCQLFHEKEILRLFAICNLYLNHSLYIPTTGQHYRFLYFAPSTRLIKSLHIKNTGNHLLQVSLLIGCCSTRRD